MAYDETLGGFMVEYNSSEDIDKLSGLLFGYRLSTFTFISRSHHNIRNETPTTAAFIYWGDMFCFYWIVFLGTLRETEAINMKVGQFTTPS